MTAAKCLKILYLKYKKYLDELGMVTSEVVISAPDTKTHQMSH